MSTINETANNIDVLYPIAGQENSSQGFRDNFLNIQLSLLEADAEVTFLQTDAVSKSTINNDMGGNQISTVSLTNLGITSVTDQTVTLPITPIYYNQGSYQEFNLSSDTTFIVINWRDKGVNCPLRLLVKGTPGDRIAFAGKPGDSSVLYSDQYLPYQLSGPEITVWDLWTADGGATIYITKVGGTFVAI